MFATEDRRGKRRAGIFGLRHAGRTSVASFPPAASSCRAGRFRVASRCGARRGAVRSCNDGAAVRGSASGADGGRVFPARPGADLSCFAECSGLSLVGVGAAQKRACRGTRGVRDRPSRRPRARASGRCASDGRHAASCGSGKRTGAQGAGQKDRPRTFRRQKGLSRPHRGGRRLSRAGARETDAAQAGHGARGQTGGRRNAAGPHAPVPGRGQRESRRFRSRQVLGGSRRLA